jgi:hypothetical protein
MNGCVAYLSLLKKESPGFASCPQPAQFSRCDLLRVESLAVGQSQIYSRGEGSFTTIMTKRAARLTAEKKVLCASFCVAFCVARLFPSCWPKPRPVSATRCVQCLCGVRSGVCAARALEYNFSPAQNVLVVFVLVSSVQMSRHACFIMWERVRALHVFGRAFLPCARVYVRHDPFSLQGSHSERAHCFVLKEPARLFFETVFLLSRSMPGADVGSAHCLLSIRSRLSWPRHPRWRRRARERRQPRRPSPRRPAARREARRDPARRLQRRRPRLNKHRVVTTNLMY